MKTVYLGFFVILALGGCVSKEVPAIKEYVDRPVEVKVPVYRSCLTKEQVPEVPVVLLDTVDTTGENALMETLKAARVDRITGKEYVKVTQALLKSCT